MERPAIDIEHEGELLPGESGEPIELGELRGRRCVSDLVMDLDRDPISGHAVGGHAVVVGNHESGAEPPGSGSRRLHDRELWSELILERRELLEPRQTRHHREAHLGDHPGKRRARQRHFGRSRAER